MDSDFLLLGIVIAAIMYFAGYTAIGAVIGLLVILIFIGSAMTGQQMKSDSSAKLLEPIVLESTRSAPYRIADDLEIWYDRNATPGKKWQKIPKKWGKAIAQTINKVKE